MLARFWKRFLAVAFLAIHFPKWIECEIDLLPGKRDIVRGFVYS